SLQGSSNAALIKIQHVVGERKCHTVCDSDVRFDYKGMDGFVEHSDGQELLCDWEGEFTIGHEQLKVLKRGNDEEPCWIDRDALMESEAVMADYKKEMGKKTAKDRSFFKQRQKEMEEFKRGREEQLRLLRIRYIAQCNGERVSPIPEFPKKSEEEKKEELKEKKAARRAQNKRKRERKEKRKK
ncbi:hypothetical protein PFISCL1PPCAC_9169, partial [Pristionchus fissidentatus]